MNTHTHTPAPWEIEEPSKGCPSFIVHTDTDEIAFVLSSEHNDHGAANARLISAAPELLATLKFLVAACGGGLTNGDYPCAMDAARAAIAKAEGRKA